MVWIEISMQGPPHSPGNVTTFAVVWIEIGIPVDGEDGPKTVTTFAVVWIEILTSIYLTSLI